MSGAQDATNMWRLLREDLSKEISGISLRIMRFVEEDSDGNITVKDSFGNPHDEDYTRLEGCSRTLEEDDRLLVAKIMGQGENDSFTYVVLDKIVNVALDPLDAYTDEMARDAIGSALTAGTGITISVSDGSDTITVSLTTGMLTQLFALTDPGADRILFWDESANTLAWLQVGSGLGISGTTLSATGGSYSLTVQEGGSNVDTGVTLINFDSTDFNVSNVSPGHTGITLAYGTSANTPAEGNHTHLLATGATDITASAAEVNVLDGMTSTTAELNILDGATLSTTELNYVDGVTSPIQTQINGKANTSHAHSAADITSGTLPAVRGGTGETTPVAGSILIGFDSTNWAQLTPNATATRKFLRDVSSGLPGWDTLQAGDMPSGIDATKIAGGGVTSTEFDYLANVTSDIQTQFSNKQPLDADLTTIAGLTATTDNFIVSVASAWASRTPAQVRTTLALVPGTNVMAYDAELQQIAGLADPNADRILFWDDSAGTYAFLTPSTGLAISGTNMTVDEPALTLSNMGGSVTDTQVPNTLRLDQINDTNNAAALTVNTTASAVNYLQVKNAASGGHPSLSAVGSGTNIDLMLAGKGTGKIYANGWEVVDVANAQTLLAKNLTQPTIGDFVNANHTHQNSAGGGTLAAAAIASGVLSPARITASTLTEGYIMMYTGGALGLVTPALAGNIYALSGGSVNNAVVVFDGTSGNVIKMADGSGNDALITNGADLNITIGSNIVFDGSGIIDMGATGEIHLGSGGNIIMGTSGQIQMGSAGSIVLSAGGYIAVGGSSLGIADTSGNAILTFGASGTPANNLKVSSVSASNNPKLEPVGSDTNIGIDFVAKGSGQIRIGSSRITTVADKLDAFAATTSSELRTVISDETGTGGLVFAQSPTIVTPTIASFTNAAHNHLTAAGGGQLSNYVTLGPFHFSNPATSATNQMQAQFMDTTTTVALNTGEWYMPRAGEIVGLFVTASANRTAGTATFTPTVNGTSQNFDGGAVCALDATNTRRHSIYAATGDGEDVSSGQRVGVQMVTASYTPTTADFVAHLVVRIDF